MPDPREHCPVSGTLPTSTARMYRWEVLDLLTSLVQKSLVVYEEGEHGQGRYRLLESVRQYSRDRLVDVAEGERMRDQHLQFHLKLAEQAEPYLRTPAQVEWLDTLEIEHDNLRAALSWSIEREPEAGLRLAAALWWFWFYRNHWQEGRQQLAAVLGHPAAPVSPGARAHALVGAVWLAYTSGDMAGLDSLVEECLTLSQEAGDPWLTSFALAFAATLAMTHAHPEEAAARSEECLRLAESDSDPWLLAVALMVRGFELFQRREYERAEGPLREAVAWAEQSGERFITANVSINLAMVLLVSGHHDPIRALIRRSLELVRELGQKMWFAPCLEILAGVEATEGNGERAARLLGAAAALREAIGYPVEPPDRIFYDWSVSTTRDRLSPEQYMAAWAAGQALTLEQAIVLGLQENHP